VRWVLDAALSHSRAVGLSIEAFRARGQSFVVHRHELDYLRPAFVGDLIEVETRVLCIRTASSVRETLIRREIGGDVLLRARTSWAYIDLESGRATRIPADVRDRFPIDDPQTR
jgi:acyl-CoA thioester hydrolase